MLVIILLVGLLAVMVLMVAGGKQPAAPRPPARQFTSGDRLDAAHVCDERCTRPEAMCPYQLPPNSD
ncbi:MAG: hypothetical protein WCO82_08620 [Sphingomonadales bacterium]|jgi:hypothetical protein